MSEGGRVKPPEAKSAPKPPEPTVESTSSSQHRGFSAVRDERTQAVESVRYRLTGGAQGTAPAGHIASERRAVIGAAAARIMRKATGPAGEGQIPKGSGTPLPADVKAQMEPKLGADLSAVRLHTGADSAKAATNFGARAFTVGNDVHFNAGQFAPGSKEGTKLLAHELTHVVQGQQTGVQRKADDGEGSPASDANPGVSDPSEPAEREADDIADHVAGEVHENGGADEKANKKQDESKKDESKKGDGKKPDAAHDASVIHRAPADGAPAGGPPRPVEKVVQVGDGQKTLRASLDNEEVIVVGEGPLLPLLERANAAPTSTATGKPGGAQGAPPPSPDAQSAATEARANAQQANALVPALKATDPDSQQKRTRLDALLGAIGGAWNRLLVALGSRAPLPPPVTDPAAIPSVHNVPVGTPLDTAGPGHGALSRLSLGDREGLAPVGVGPLPANFRPNSCEWGLGELPTRQFILIKGEVDQVNWGPLQGVKALAHSHPSLEDGSNQMHPVGGSMRFNDLIQNPTNLIHMFPSIADLQFCLDRGIAGHKVHTPFLIDQMNEVRNPATGATAAANQGTPLQFAIGPVTRFKPRSEGVYLTSTLTATAGGRPVWQGPVFTRGPYLLGLTRDA